MAGCILQSLQGLNTSGRYVQSAELSFHRRPSLHQLIQLTTRCSVLIAHEGVGMDFRTRISTRSLFKSTHGCPGYVCDFMGGARTLKRISIRAYKNESVVISLAGRRRSSLCRSIFAVSSCVFSVVFFSHAPNLCFAGRPVCCATFTTEYHFQLRPHGVLASGTDQQRHSKCEERILDLAPMVHISLSVAMVRLVF